MNERPEERNIHLVARDVADVDEALAWVVGHLDTTFKSTSMLSIHIQRFTASRGDEDGWHYAWEATMGGLVEGGPDAG